MKKKFRMNLSTTQTILLSFLLAILFGSALLALPVSSADGVAVPYIDALFTATTSICVTGLVTVPTFSTWSLFGQIVILFLIQIGGLGVVTIMSGLMISLHRRIGIKDRMLIQDAFNLNTLSGMVKFIRKVIAGTFLVEGIGALLYMAVFVPEFGPRGVWISLFNSVSAFCNAGMDVISENSLYAYVHNPVINITTILLIVFGGIGYIVWWDIVGSLKNIRRQRLKCFANLTLHSKIALSVTGILILAGTAAIFIFEYNNPLTMDGFSLFEKLQASLFQSVTTRTAGFATIPQEDLTNASALVSLLLMFIGGSPVGTAGGIKTVTFAVLITSAFATMKTHSEAELFHRTIPKHAVSKAVAVVSMAFIILFMATLLLSAVTDADALDIVYETVSAAATVGLTRSLTSELNIWGRIIIIITMYLGRVGPISLMIALNTKKETKNIIKNPTEDISVG
ncbi:MAG: potassium transporter KtrB [Lachnospiraceae bacterium]|nr:potassium transporter KtrB [Lachnospiraceae bacterium]